MSDCEKLALKLVPDDWLALYLSEIQSELHFEWCRN